MLGTFCAESLSSSITVYILKGGLKSYVLLHCASHSPLCMTIGLLWPTMCALPQISRTQVAFMAVALKCRT